MVFGAGQGAFALAALQVIGVAPLRPNPVLQLNVATLPWLSSLLFVTPPFPGALALAPVHRVRVHCGVVLGAGQGASALAALQVIDDAPLSLNPLLQVNVATLPWLSPLFFDTPPFPGALALEPVHLVRVQLPLGVAPLQVIVPLNPVLHAHDKPAALLELAMLHGATDKTTRCVCE